MVEAASRLVSFPKGLSLAWGGGFHRALPSPSQPPWESNFGRCTEQGFQNGRNPTSVEPGCDGPGCPHKAAGRFHPFVPLPGSCMQPGRIQNMAPGGGPAPIGPGFARLAGKLPAQQAKGPQRCGRRPSRGPGAKVLRRVASRARLGMVRVGDTTLVAMAWRRQLVGHRAPWISGIAFPVEKLCDAMETRRWPSAFVHRGDDKEGRWMIDG